MLAASRREGFEIRLLYYKLNSTRIIRGESRDESVKWFVECMFSCWCMLECITIRLVHRSSSWFRNDEATSCDNWLNARFTSCWFSTNVESTALWHRWVFTRQFAQCQNEKRTVFSTSLWVLTSGSSRHRIYILYKWRHLNSCDLLERLLHV